MWERGTEGQEKGGRWAIKRDGRQDPLFRTVDRGPCAVWPSNSGCHAASVLCRHRGPPDRSLDPVLTSRLLIRVAWRPLRRSLLETGSHRRCLRFVAPDRVSHGGEAAAARRARLCAVAHGPRREEGCRGAGCAACRRRAFSPASSASRGASPLASNPRLSRCPTVPQEATTTFQLNSHSRENISPRVWPGSRSQRFSTDRFSCGGCVVCMNLQLACMMVRDHCMHYGWRQRRQWQVGPEQTCENSELLAAAKGGRSISS
jgi:hypothetical protein